MDLEFCLLLYVLLSGYLFKFCIYAPRAFLGLPKGRAWLGVRTVIAQDIYTYVFCLYLVEEALLYDKNRTQRNDLVGGQQRLLKEPSA